MGHNPLRWANADWRVLTTVNAAGTNDLMCLPKHGVAQDNFFFGHPSRDRPLRKLLNDNDRGSRRLSTTTPSYSNETKQRGIIPLMNINSYTIILH
ncbi:unnamed protein product [Diatraea saccharalis]|uniref:Uncharacterized protein n=1 Tax=Diatraea saccharalis TaxID=40085 RepID=A0A9N9WAJ1_9NEOP|nr:unnamed protein product [Diatraea saccharalis]